MAVSVVEFSHGLAVPFMEPSVGKRWGQLPRDLGASSELGSERYKKQRSERSERYKKAALPRVLLPATIDRHSVRRRAPAG